MASSSSSSRYKPRRLPHQQRASSEHRPQPLAFPDVAGTYGAEAGPAAAMMARKEDHHHRHHLRALAARAVTDSLRAAAPTAAERAARFEDCVRSLEAEKAKMEVFSRELPISVHLVADGT